MTDNGQDESVIAMEWRGGNLIHVRKHVKGCALAAKGFVGSANGHCRPFIAIDFGADYDVFISPEEARQLAEQLIAAVAESEGL